MSVYVDNARMDVPGVGKLCCHMVADSVSALVATAELLGISGTALQTKHVTLPCFYLTQSKRRYALRVGYAKDCTAAKMVELIDAHRKTTAATKDAPRAKATRLDDVAGGSADVGAGDVSSAPVRKRRVAERHQPDQRHMRIHSGTRCDAMHGRDRCRMSAVARFQKDCFCEHHMSAAKRGVVEPYPDAPSKKKPWIPARERTGRGPPEFSMGTTGGEMRAEQRWDKIDAAILTVPCLVPEQNWPWW